MKNRAWAIAALVVAVSAAATGTSSADSGAVMEGKVQIHVTGSHTGPQPSPGQHRIAHGRFALSGALSDRGIFEDYRHANSPRVRMLFGAKGMITIAFVGPAPSWRIVRGWFAYTGLRGRGKGRGPRSPGAFQITMIGTVSQYGRAGLPGGSSNAANGPGFASTRSDERLPPVGQRDHIARLDVRSGMLDQAEVVAGRVVDAVVHSGDYGDRMSRAATCHSLATRSGRIPGVSNDEGRNPPLPADLRVGGAGLEPAATCV